MFVQLSCPDPQFTIDLPLPGDDRFAAPLPDRPRRLPLQSLATSAE